MKYRFRFLFFLIPVAFVLLGSLAVMGLWNWLMPTLFGLGVVSFLQAAALLLLARLLLGGFGRPRFGGRFSGRPYAYAGPGGPMRRRWESLTPEQRAQWAGRCGRRQEAGPQAATEPNPAT